MSRRSTKQRRAARGRAAIYRSIERERRARETFRRAFRHLAKLARFVPDGATLRSFS